MTKPKEPLRFTKSKDKYGTVWCSRPASSWTTPIEVWIDSKDKTAERIWLRQETKGHVDLIQLDIGQAYDVIRALSEALDNG